MTPYFSLPGQGISVKFLFSGWFAKEAGRGEKRRENKDTYSRQLILEGLIREQGPGLQC